MDRSTVQAWLDAYVHAWITYDPTEIGSLFSENAAYCYHPYDEPVRGREAIVAAWLDERDPAGTYTAHYEPIAIDGQVAVANGRSRYFEQDGVTLKTEFDNEFVLRFDGAGRCTEFKEWYFDMKQR